MQDFIQGLPRRQPLPMFSPLKLHMDAGISLLPNGSTITLRTASGDIIDERCGLPKEVIVTCKSSKLVNAEWLTDEWSRKFSAVMQVEGKDIGGSPRLGHIWSIGSPGLGKHELF